MRRQRQSATATRTCDGNTTARQQLDTRSPSLRGVHRYTESIDTPSPSYVESIVTRSPLLRRRSLRQRERIASNLIKYLSNSLHRYFLSAPRLQRTKAPFSTRLNIFGPFGPGRAGRPKNDWPDSVGPVQRIFWDRIVSVGPVLVQFFGLGPNFGPRLRPKFRAARPDARPARPEPTLQRRDTWMW